RAKQMVPGAGVVLIKEGVVQKMGEPLELYNEPANRFVAGFIGSPAMNFADAGRARQQRAIYAEGDGIRLKVPAHLANRAGNYVGKEVTLGVRPEDLRVANDADPADMT